MRALLIEDAAQKNFINSTDFIHDSICKLETDIDDASGELLGYTLQWLLEAVRWTCIMLLYL